MGVFSANVVEAIPHLEMLDNKRVRQLLRLLERRQPISLMVIAVMITLLMVLNWLGAGMVLREFQFAAAARGFDLGNPFTVGVSVAVLVALMLPGPVLAMCIRDWWLRRLVRRRALNMDCFSCSYPLASLEAIDEVTCCPECGTHHRTIGEVMLPTVILDSQPITKRGRKPKRSAVSLMPGTTTPRLCEG
jgi:hypothetical protein